MAFIFTILLSARLFWRENMKVFATHKVISAFALVITLILSGAVTASAQGECNFVGAPVVQTGSIAGGDTAQTNRLFRDGRATTCLINRAATTSAGAYNSDSYTYTNTTGGPICVYVDLDTVGCGVATNQLGIAAYSTSYVPTSILTNLIADPGLSTGQSFGVSLTFPVPTGGTYIVVVHNINAGTVCTSYTFKKYESNGCRNPGFDRANDGSADLSVFRPATGDWFSMTTAGVKSANQFGSAADTPAPGDYTGDETTDTAVFRNTGTWFTNPGAGDFGARNWGTAGDVPVQGDYDRDFKTDLAVYRPISSLWLILRSEDNTWLQFSFGASGDKPAPADFDGDGRTDPALFRPSNGLWNIISSAGNSASGIQTLWGTNNDIPVPADYDGDGKADIAVWRPSDGIWYIVQSSLLTNNQLFLAFGTNGDRPQPADYDGDRKADLAVYRPSSSFWYIQRSTAGFYAAKWGQAGDVPASSPNPNTNQ
jgi:hypothetical protein